ncbi:MAG: HI1506-related protein [Roseibium sp.]
MADDTTQTNSGASATSSGATSSGTKPSGSGAQSGQKSKGPSKAAPKQKAKDSAAAKMTLRITAKPKEGFRRCGVHHPSEAVDYPEGRFTPADVKALKAETNLVVEDL